MKVVLPKQMNEIDNMTITQMGIPGIVLMENAALRVVDEVIRDIGNVRGRNIIAFAGKGNNGGDAFAVARHLFNKGADIKVYLLAEKKNIAGDAYTNLEILEKMHIDVEELVEQPQLEYVRNDLLAAELIIDGIFGTGFKGEARGLASEVINLVNRSGKRVISIDIPSGVCGVSGHVEGVCIKASKTVTFGFPKAGLVIHPGCEHAGKLVVADIGIPSAVTESFDIRAHVVEEAWVSGILPCRNDDSNKGTYGKVFIISGSTGMTGAGVLSAKAALRAGAGLVYLGVPTSLVPAYDSLLIEAVKVPLEDGRRGYLSTDCTAQIKEKLKKMSVAAIGPGLSTNDGIFDIVNNIITESEIPLILDADALNVISKNVGLLRKLKCSAVITPHPGEMARLSGISISDVQNNRIEVAREFAVKWKVITVLKGSRTVTALPDGTVYINTTGNSGMATGGTGDVLTGIIAAFAGQGLSPGDAAIAGVYVHGLAGDSAARAKGEHGMIAGDIVEELPKAIKQLIDVKSINK